MRNNMKRRIAALLVWLQIFTLLPLAAQAADTVPSGETAAAVMAADPQETPVLNETVVGTVKFQSFNFLGDNAAGIDGTDYQSTYYYTDDYFAPSAVNANATKQVENWTALDNPSLAACSMDFAVASYTSAEGDVISASSRTWDNSDYSNKDKNVRAFLSECGFENIEPHGLTVKPTMDSIGYTLASKPITVWDEATQTNKTCTLVAVGVRGAGYGPEWASNVTIGTAGQGASVVRHKGFDDGAQTVCAGIRSFLAAHNITGDVKYWVCGFSRAAAVANLTAGYLTDNPGTYKTSIDDVYGYTYECPQAASTSENALNYKNIHNIVNPLDAVPKVSPTGFRHQRLGVDYLMPYYKNAGNQNTTYYNRMFEVLKTIAVGNGREADHLVSDIQNYPYNQPLPIYTMTATRLIADAVGGNLMNNFGTEAADDTWLIGNVDSLLGGGQWYMDDFIDHLIDVFLTSTAWDRGYTATNNVITHRTRFIDNYQEDFRVALGYLIDYSGPAFLVLIDKVLGAVGDSLGISDAGMGLAFLNVYNDPKGSYTSSWLNPEYYLIDSSWRGKPKKDVLITEAQSKVVDVVTNMTSGYSHATITKSRLDQALKHITAVVIDLYADELDKYDAQYFGTSLHWLWTILATHEQETVLSWIMSLDQNHMNRSCRTVMVPRAADAELHEYRAQYAQYDGSPEDVTSTAPVVASWENGVWTSKDERITYTASGDYLFIRYPASLQIRTDVKANGNLNLGGVAMDDYMTTSETVNVSAGADQFVSALPSSASGDLSGYRYITTNAQYTNASAKNNLLAAYGALEQGDVLHILANGTAAYNSTTSYDLIIDKAPQTAIADYGAPGAELDSGASMDSAVTLGGSSSTDTEAVVRGIKTRQNVTTVPASSIYYDDELTGGSADGYAGETTRVDSDEAGRTIWLQFTGTRIDVYCTTDEDNGYVQAAVTDADGNIVTVNGQRMVVTMLPKSDTARYNVPVISFDGLDANTTYYLKLYAVKGSNFRLDGVRVYHAADETDRAVQAAYEAAGEQNANYVNLRALLLGAVSEDTLSENTEAGAVFYTDSGESYAVTSAEYAANSPKNEIYLASGQSVAFQIVGEYETVAVGLSAPDRVDRGGSVEVTDGTGKKTLPVANALDQYYPVTPAPNGSVMITNRGSAMIALTNVKLSGNYTPPAEPLSFESPLVVSDALLRYAAAFPGLPVDVPKETWSADADAVPAVLQALFRLLLEQLASLFAGVADW